MLNKMIVKLEMLEGDPPKPEFARPFSGAVRQAPLAEQVSWTRKTLAGGNRWLNL